MVATKPNTRSHSRDISARSFASRRPSRKGRAQGRPGARCTRGPAGCCKRDMLPTSIQVQRRASGLPCAMALRLIRFRPGDRLDCHHRRYRLSPRDLTPAPGRRTQTISPYARTRLRQKAMPGVTALVSRSLASIAPCPSFATMAYAPPAGQDGGSCKSDLPDGATDLFSIRGIDMISDNRN